MTDTYRPTTERKHLSATARAAGDALYRVANDCDDVQVPPSELDKSIEKALHQLRQFQCAHLAWDIEHLQL